MSILEEIKEKYAVQQGFDSWKELWFDSTNFKHANERIDEVAKRYAKECSAASLEKSGNNTIHLLETYNLEHSEIKAEITDSENIVLL